MNKGGLPVDLTASKPFLLLNVHQLLAVPRNTVLPVVSLLWIAQQVIRLTPKIKNKD